MKVLLLQDLKGKGKAGDIINLNDGYARNFIIPREIGIPADASNINAANIKKSAAAHQQKLAREAALKLADDMSGLTVKVYAKAGENGKLFGSIGVQEIADALMEQYHVEVDKKKIRIAEPIKTLGIIDVSAHMYEHTDAKFKVEVLPLVK